VYEVLLKKNHLFLLILIISIVLILSTSCAPDNEASINSPTYFEIDPIFSEFYFHLGGIDRLGPAISGISIDGSKTIQYMETCKLIYDADAMPTQHFLVAPLGLEMGLSEPAIPPPENQGYRYVDGHTIHPDFEQLYEEMGMKIVGRPLTEARFNLAKNQHEQFFENFGFYRKKGESQTQLMPYGLWACGAVCSRGAKQSNAILDSYHQVDSAFMPFVEQHGTNFTGFPLTAGFTSQDGKWQQVFENMVLVTTEKANPAATYLLSLPEKLNLIVEPPQPYNGNPDFYFYTIQGDQGYEIPDYFWDYIAKHGGIELFGVPIQHISNMDNQIIRQCFTELCLLYDPFAIEGARIRPEPLGYSYEYLYMHAINYQTPTPNKDLFFNTPVPTEAPAHSEFKDNEMILQVWEKYPTLEVNQIQEIGVLVSNGNNPLTNIKVELMVEFPDQTLYSINMPPTRQDGKTFALLPPIDAPNSSLID